MGDSLGFSQRSPARVLVRATILAGVTNLYRDGYTDDGVGAGPGAPAPRGRGWLGGPRKRAAALIVTCAIVAGGAFAVTEAVSGSGPSTAGGTASVPASGPNGAAAVLSGALSEASPGSAAAGTSAQPAARVALRRLRRAIARLRALGGMYGQYTFRTRDGRRTLSFERGVITSIEGDDATVRAADGAAWTWTLTGSSVVRQDGTREPATALARGEQVFTAGSVSNGTRDAVLVVIRRPASKPASTEIK
jgi:hypothetical protein